jgi:drug/metabolite transporter (DMT)-like permease
VTDILSAAAGEPVGIGLAVVVLGEPLTLLVGGGVCLLVIGSIAVGSEAQMSPVTATGSRLRRDLAFPLVAALLYGIDPVVTKLGSAAGGSADVGLAARTGTAAARFGAYLAWRALRAGRWPSVTVDRWLLVAGAANAGYLLAYYGALARAPVIVVTPIMSLSTLFVVGGAAALLPTTEGVTRRLAAAAVVVVLGAVLVAWP